MSTLSIRIPDGFWKWMQDHVEACLPEEACGLLGGREGRVRMVLPVWNALRSATRFRMDPQGQISALARIEEEGEEMIGIYHSHPNGPPRPSKTDFLEAAFPEVGYLIWSRRGEGWQCGAFRLVGEGFVPLPIQWERRETSLG